MARAADAELGEAQKCSNIWVCLKKGYLQFQHMVIMFNSKIAINGLAKPHEIPSATRLCLPCSSFLCSGTGAESPGSDEASACPWRLGWNSRTNPGHEG